MSVARERLRDERGFTLIELLTALLLSTIVAMATLAIVIVSVHFTSNFNDRVDANQQGRLAMEKITQALNSSCVATNTPPVVAGSDASHVVFYSSLTDAPAINPSQVTVTYASGAQNGTLTMYTAPWASGTSAATWTFGTQSAFTLLAHVTQATISGATTPVFQYYGYTAGGAISTTPYTVPLSAPNASTTADGHDQLRGASE